MNQSLLIWLIGGLAGFVFAVTVGGLSAYISLVQRVTRMETNLEIAGRTAAGILHSDSTPELDELLEKCSGHANTLTLDETIKLIKMCDGIVSEKDGLKAQRALAAIVSAMCKNQINLPHA